ncbi:MAG: hypothetical protein FWF86_03450, partial [Clostridia bacterium]|nr:hypothetical protein [Clostridia bacterium]
GHSISAAEEIFAADALEKLILLKTKSTPYAKLDGHRGLGRADLLHEDRHDAKNIINATNRRLKNILHPGLAPNRRYGIKEVFRTIPFHPTIIQVIEQAYAVDLPENFVVLHMRSGDVVFGAYRREALRHAKRAVPIQLAKMILEHEKRPVLLFGEDQDTLRRLADSHGHRLAADFYPSIAMSNTQRAFFEMLLMSRAAEIYAGIRTLFARTALFLGRDIKMTDIHTKFSQEDMFDFFQRDLAIHAPGNKALQNAFSYAYLYLIGRERKSPHELMDLLAAALAHDPENDGYRIFTAIELFRAGDAGRADALLGNCLHLQCEDEPNLQKLAKANLISGVAFGRLYWWDYLAPVEQAALQDWPWAALTLALCCQRLPEKGSALDWLLRAAKILPENDMIQALTRQARSAS